MESQSIPPPSGIARTDAVEVYESALTHMIARLDSMASQVGHSPSTMAACTLHYA